MKNINFLKNNLIAHRGYFTKSIPENTLMAFSKAIDNDYIIEFDIHYLCDGNIVVYHDFNLKRLTGKNEIIETMDLESLNKLKIDKKYTIPTFEQVLNLVKGKVPLLIEIKDLNNNGKFFEKVSNILSNYKGLFAIQSMNPKVIDWFYKNKKDYVIGLIVLNDINYRIFKKSTKMIDFLSINKKDLPFKSKKMILGWTIKNKKEFDKYKKLCDNLICNIGEIYDKRKE